MSSNVVTKEKIKHSLDTWYQSMLQQQVGKATRFKEEVDNKINHVETDQDILLYYALLDFRYKVLTDWLNIKKDSFDSVESFEVAEEGFLAYYYHFFKAFYFRITENYTEAKKQFEKAETLLKYIQNPIEKAEFNYRLGEFYYHTYQQVKSIEYLQKAKEEFIKHSEYEINVALCENVYGLCCIELKHFELAEESFNIALNIFQKVKHEKYILMIRSNFGWLYGSQNLSELAIRHVSEVVEKLPEHYKAVFTMAEECYKLGKIELAESYIASGIKICNELKNKEFLHRFMILKELNKDSNTIELEKAVLEGISYFESVNLLECIIEYSQKLAIKFHEEGNYLKASQYFYMSNNASKKHLEKGALK
ncbi:RapH N-terminal domain-containing protein [Bacillus pseudomycoides]|uniref:response regulator aspartate phosphatase n=1 Tax=Bacillus pseudomycoides TaxID=64104 RepID=UPI000BF3383A|nr:RapH N-terminal domain-containing protein [Bacillus pseudomycoides]MED1537008.1 RapH N-terminal domain-containing protein [Bacillus pseudomycoides]PGC39744.1 hypothetical protein COM18_17105 [Bacillus pseudomycoides]